MENKRWTKKYLLLIWIITLIVVVAAITGHLVKVRQYFGFGGGSIGNVQANNYDYTNENIKEISVDMNAADINITYGSKFSVDTSFPEKYSPDVEVKNGKLVIKQRESVKNIKGLEDFHLDITLPSDANLDSVKIDVSAGDIDINNVAITKLNLDANAGDIDINEITADRIEIDANAGDINVMDSTANIIKVNVNAGDVDITGDYEKINCSCDLGDVDINAPNTDRNDIDVDCALGSVNVVAQ